MNKGTGMDEKKAYSTPRLRAYGDVESLTHDKPVVGIDDASWNSSKNYGAKDS